MGPQARKYLIWGGITLAAGSIIAGLYLYYKQQVKLALQYCYKLSGIRLFRVNKNSFAFELFMKIQNKSNFTVSLNGYDLDIYLNEKKIANVKSDKKHTVLQNGVSELSFEVDFNPSKIFDKEYILTLISYGLTDQSKIILHVTGHLNVTMDFVKIKKMKFDYKTSMGQIMNQKPDANLKCDII